MLIFGFFWFLYLNIFWPFLKVNKSIEKFHIEFFIVFLNNPFWNIDILDIYRKANSYNYEHINLIEHYLDLKYHFVIRKV